MQLKIQLCDALIPQNWECGHDLLMLTYSQRQSLTVQHMYCIRVCFMSAHEREGSFYDLCSNCSLISDSDVRSELLYYTTGTGICDLHLHFHSMWHWQSFLHHPLPTPPVCVRESVCVCVCVCPQSVLQSCLPTGSLSLSLCEIKAGVACITRPDQMHCK